MRTPLLFIVATLGSFTALSQTLQYRIGVSYNTNVYAMSEPFMEAKRQFQSCTNIELIALPYGDPRSFYESLEPPQIRSLDLILGPTDSEALKSFAMLAPFETPTFLSSFVTTKKSLYKNLGSKLILATPTDEERIKCLRR